jgi:hypothetical protein
LIDCGIICHKIKIKYHLLICHNSNPVSAPQQGNEVG